MSTITEWYVEDLRDVARDVEQEDAAKLFTWERLKQSSCPHTRIGPIVAVKDGGFGMRLAFCKDCNWLMEMRANGKARPRPL